MPDPFNRTRGLLAQAQFTFLGGSFRLLILILRLILILIRLLILIRMSSDCRLHEGD
jgi:hypothetical protein